jgi:PAS domain S-box-containing protein
VTELDIRTILGLLAVLNIFLSVVMVLYWRTQKVYPGFGLWTLCNASVALMWVLFFLRGHIPMGVSIVLPNLLASLALVLRLEGLRRFLGRARFDYRMLALPALVLVLQLVLTFVHDDAYARTAVITWSVGVVVWVMAALVLARASGANRFTYSVIGLMWLLYGLLNITRGVYWLVVAQGSPLLEPGMVNELYYTATMVFDIGWTVVFFTMNHQRTAIDLAAAQTVAETARDQLADIVAFLPDATFAVDSERRVIAWNRAAEELIGLPASDVMGRPYAESVAPALGEQRPILLDLALDPGMPVPGHYAAVARDGDRVSAEVDPVDFSGRRFSVLGTASPLRNASGEIVGAIESVKDISALKRAERERSELLRRILESQRLKSLGAMAGGISHDYNNLLAIIIGNLEMAEGVQQGFDQAGFLEAAKQAALRAAELTEHMRAYARGGSIKPGPMDLAGFVAESSEVLRRALKDGLSLEFALEPTPPVLGDRAAMLQVLTVLLTNAAEALEGKNGTITVATGAADCDEQCIARSHLTERPAPGRFAYLKVTDMGVGMSRETLDRMFDPFFTTKFPGRGLGLSAASGIVAAHRGVIVVDSTPDEGTSFTVYIPAAEASGSPS